MGKYITDTLQLGSNGVDKKIWERFHNTQRDDNNTKRDDLKTNGIFGKIANKAYQVANTLFNDRTAGLRNLAASVAAADKPLNKPTSDTADKKFTWAYNEDAEKLIKDYINRKDFSYDFNADALYQQYKDKFIQQGKLAMADTMGQAAAMTGGYGNSYAQSLGQQAFQNSLDNLNDIVPELYQMAYERYNQEGKDMLDTLGVLGDDYNREFNTWNANNTNAWNRAEFDEAIKQFMLTYGLDERQVKLQEDAYENSKKNTVDTASGIGDNDDISETVPSYVTSQIENFGTISELNSYLDTLKKAGELTQDQAVYLQTMYSNDLQKGLDDRNWTLESKGGLRIGALDDNAKVKDQYGNIWRIDELYKALKSPPYNYSPGEAKAICIQIQKDLGITNQK